MLYLMFYLPKWIDRSIVRLENNIKHILRCLTTSYYVKFFICISLNYVYFIKNNKEWCKNADFFQFHKYIECSSICKKSSPSFPDIFLLQWTAKLPASELLSIWLKMQSSQYHSHWGKISEGRTLGSFPGFWGPSQDSGVLPRWLL